MSYGTVCSVCGGTGFSGALADPIRDTVIPAIALLLVTGSFVLSVLALNTPQFDKVFNSGLAIIVAVAGYYGFKKLRVA